MKLVIIALHVRPTLTIQTFNCALGSEHLESFRLSSSSILNSSGTPGRPDRTLTPRSVHTTPVIGRVMPPRASKANVEYTPKTPTRTPRKTPARSVVKVCCR